MKKKEIENQQKLMNWFQFWTFIKNAEFSWFWIAIAIGINMWYYTFIKNIPGSTAALFTGKFTKAAIMGLIENYTWVLVLLCIVNFVIVFATAKSVRSVRRAIWARMMKIETKYYDQHGPNYLLSSVTSDASAAVGSLMSLLVTVPGLITYLVKALPAINDFSPKLMWAVVVLIPVYILYSVLMGKWQFKMGMSIQMRIGGITGFLTDRIRNLSLIKAYTTEEKEEEKGIEAAKELYDVNIEYSKLNAIVIGCTILMEVMGVIIAVVWGSHLLKTGEIDLEGWLAFFLFAPTINTVLRQLTSIWTSLKDVQGRAIRLGGLMEAPEELFDEKAIKLTDVEDIKFNDVTFSYIENNPVLKNVSFTIPKGKTTAIVGPSGSGKTTIIRLMEHLYTPEKGSITIGNTNINDINLSNWREKLSYVNQSAELFSGTIREALTYGLTREATDEELIEATKIAGIYEYIKNQKDGFDSELALWGGSLSGGQRQRMVIARELLRNAEVLLLDEATSALDVETATAISDTFFKGFRGKTIVTITHELSYIANADQIIVMNNGEVIAVGSHKELMATNEVYRRLVEQQSYQEVFE